MEGQRSIGAILALAVGLTLVWPGRAGARVSEDEAVRAASCATLLTGTSGTPKDFLPPEAPTSLTPLLNDQATSEPTDDEAARLPERVDLRASTASFNERYEFALLDGSIFVRERESGDPWLKLHLPACFAGRLAALSADDEQLIAVDEDRAVYTMDYALGDVWTFNWTARWGPYFWANVGIELPEDTVTWSKSNLTAAADGGWVDEAGNFNESGGVTTVYLLREDRQRITFLDPWLPIDYSYEMCGPQRGTLRIAELSASGSVTFVAGFDGSLWTRLYDFDTSGSNAIFHTGSYEDQRGREDHVIQLPASPWVRQPEPPGLYTDVISIEKRRQADKTNMVRLLRIEGALEGETGYWEKDWRDEDWAFVPTGRELTGTPLPHADEPSHGPAEDLRFTGTVGDVEVEVPDFNPYCNEATLVLRAGNDQLHLTLHTVDGLRQEQRARGLDDEAHEYYGVIEVPAEILSDLDGLPPALRSFVEDELQSEQWPGFAVSAFRDRLLFGADSEQPCHVLWRDTSTPDLYGHEPPPETIRPRLPLDPGAEMASWTASWDYDRTRRRC